MATTKSWPGGSSNVTTTTYSIPATGNVNWGSLSNFLIALADGAQSTTFQKYAIRKATTTPVTVVAATDCVVVVDLAVAGPSTVNLPAGVSKQVLYIVDGKGDAGTNNITIVPNGVQTIAGAASYVMTSAGQTVMLAFNNGDTDWKIVGVSNPPGTNIGGFTASKAIVSDASGILSSATTTSTEIGYVNGVTSSIQAQLDAKATNPLTTTGDTLYASNTATPATLARRGIGSTDQVYVVAGGLPTWNTIANASISAAAAIALNKLAAVTASRALVSDGSGFVSAATTTATEIGYVNGVTSAIQTQLNTKATNPLTTTGDTIYASNTAAPSTLARLAIGSTDQVYVVAGGLPTWNTIANASISASAAIAVNKLAAVTVSRALVSDASGFISAATTTSTEIGYVNGVTSAIQTQLNAKLSTTLTSASILVGNGSNVATAVAMSGAVAITNAGVTSFAAGTTGSGAVTLATSPTIATPVINGLTDGSSAAAGVVGQVITTTSSSRFIQSSPTLGTYYAVTSFSVALTAGDWDIYVTGGSDVTLTTPNANNATSLVARLYNVTDSAVVVEQVVCLAGGTNFTLPLYSGGSVSLTANVSISGTKTYQLYIAAVTVTGTAATVSSITFNEGNKTYKIFGRRRR